MRQFRCVTGFVAVALLGLGVASHAAAQGTWRVSVPTPHGGGTIGAQTQADGYTGSPSISADGRFVAFWGDVSNLVSGDTNGDFDVFVHDRQTATTTRVSVDSFGIEGNDGSFYPSISADGRFVMFSSYATNLVAGDSNLSADVFVHDRQTATTTRVSVSSSGNEGDDHVYGGAEISADGNIVAFSSFATNLVPGDTNADIDVFVHDRRSATTTRVSVDSAGVEGNDHSLGPSLSADGRFVMFYSYASNLVAGDTNGYSDTFVHDRQTATTTRVSVRSNGNQGNDRSYGGSMSADGRFVAFTSNAANLVAGDTNRYSDAFVHDRQTATTTRVSVDSAGVEGNSGSAHQSISADGRLVAFYSAAWNLVAGDTNVCSDIFVHDRQAATTIRVSVDSSGVEGNSDSPYASMSADGRFVAFWSRATNLVAGDTNGWDDIFVHGPYLTLSAESESVAAGEELNLATWSGQPGGLAVLKIVEVNGMPVSVPFASGLFDASGLWSVDGAVPFGVSGNVVTFRAVGMTTIGTVDRTNRETVTFQ